MVKPLLTTRVSSAGMSLAWVRGSRLVLLLTALFVVITPLSEYLCHFDRFLYGGQDMELGLVALATFLCLVLLLARNGKGLLDLSLRMRQWFFAVVDAASPLAPGSFSGLIAATHAVPLPSPALGMYLLPLQI